MSTSGRGRSKRRAAQSTGGMVIAVMKSVTTQKSIPINMAIPTTRSSANASAAGGGGFVVGGDAMKIARVDAIVTVATVAAATRSAVKKTFLSNAAIAKR